MNNEVAGSAYNAMIKVVENEDVSPGASASVVANNATVHVSDEEVSDEETE